MYSHEEWRDLGFTNGIYQISNQGRIYNSNTGNILKPIKMPKGYTKVNLHYDGNRKNYQIHRLVAMTFIPNPECKPEVNHKNGIKHDNRVENLEWVTGEENRKHAYDTGLVRHKDDRYSGYLYSLWIKHHRENMCDEWQDYLQFYQWSLDNGYSNGKHIALKDSFKGYTPDNCYISSKKVKPKTRRELRQKYVK